MIPENFLHKVASENPLEALATLLAALRALGWVHQAHHWQMSGVTFYSDHLLFDRLYNDIVPEIDSLAERTAGLGHSEGLDPIAQILSTSSFVRNWNAGVSGLGPSLFVATSLGAEKDFLSLVTLVAGNLKADSTLSRGTDNLLAGIQDKHEEHVYLLSQRNKVAAWKSG